MFPAPQKINCVLHIWEQTSWRMRKPSMIHSLQQHDMRKEMQTSSTYEYRLLWLLDILVLWSVLQPFDKLHCPIFPWPETEARTTNMVRRPPVPHVLTATFSKERVATEASTEAPRNVKEEVQWSLGSSLVPWLYPLTMQGLCPPSLTHQWWTSPLKTSRLEARNSEWYRCATSILLSHLSGHVTIHQRDLTVADSYRIKKQLSGPGIAVLCFPSFPGTVSTPVRSISFSGFFL